MRYFMMLTVAATLLGAIGCDKSKQQESAVAPPPPPAPAEPVPVAPMPAYEPAPAPAPQAMAGTYTVQKGDTLYSIARRVYGDPKRVKDILAANPSIKDPNKIYVGQKITLP